MGNRNLSPSYSDRLDVDQREVSWMDRPGKRSRNDRHNLELRQYDDFMFMDGALPSCGTKPLDDSTTSLAESDDGLFVFFGSGIYFSISVGAVGIGASVGQDFQEIRISKVDIETRILCRHGGVYSTFR